MLTSILLSKGTQTVMKKALFFPAYSLSLF